MLFRKRNTPSWIIFIFDLGIVAFSLFVAYLVRFNFSIPENEVDTFYIAFPFVVISRGIWSFVFSIHRGIIRYTSSHDTERIFITVCIGTAWLAIANLLRYWFYDEAFLVPYSVIIIEYLATIFLMISLRFGVKLIYFELKNASKDKVNVVIYGAGDTAILTKRTLDRDEKSRHNVVAFIDPTGRKRGKKVEGVQFIKKEDFEDVLREEKVDHLIFATDKLSKEQRAKIIEQCLLFDVKVLNVPQVTDWINGELTYKQIKNVRIEDLLGRPEIRLDVEKMQRALSDKVILITGAAGSIGSEITRQVARFAPIKIILLDQAESALYDLEQELTYHFGHVNFEVVLADITNKNRMRLAFETYKPDIVYHAAAYKHVPMMEFNPHEAVLTNVFGTQVLADLAVEFEVERFVFVSTDKAVNPTNVMGASKRTAEKYVQASQQRGNTHFVTTRFGNVLGSNGSVIPLFKRQIEAGGPITVTHPEINRYFMTIPEACQLVLEAGTMGKGGEIFLFDMGKSIKIIDLAKKMVKLSGLKLGEDIEIKIIGLRPGEKLYEELLANEEDALKTHHPQILIAKIKENNFEAVKHELDKLAMSINQTDKDELVSRLLDIVPEFNPSNTAYRNLKENKRAEAN